MTVETFRAGQRYGDWVTVGESRLGGGGNGEVWRAAADDGRIGAIKILLPRKGREAEYRLGRFKDEIGFLVEHPNFPGILPLLDSKISDAPKEPSWYVMPEARTISAALGADPAPLTVVAAIADIATTLAALAEEGVGHRDIKPDNLFERDSHWLVGDFGLVTYPEKDPRTEHGRRLGPIDYMAPEMRQDADRAEPGPADVWALAKTLWVLLTGEQIPLPGTHIASEVAQSLQERITFTFAPELDRMLEKATLIIPEKRISMAEMARELRACTAPPPEARQSEDLSELRARMEALTATSRQTVSKSKALRDAFRQASHEICKFADEAAKELSGLLSFDIHPSTGNTSESITMLPRMDYSPYDPAGTDRLLIPPGTQRAGVNVRIVVAAIMLTQDGPVNIAALLRVNRILDNGNIQEPYDMFARTYVDIPIASAQQANAIKDIREGLTASFPATMRQVIQIISESPGGN
jgi:serine/threonine protein kinase